MDALHAAVEAKFGRSLPRLEAELWVGVQDFDAIKTSIRELALGFEAKTCADLLEARDAALPPRPCPSCGQWMERHSRAVKTFQTRLGPVGSGVVEKACKRIVGSRFKKAGCRWSKAGINALLAIRCCLENMRWPDFLEWKTCRAATA